MLVSRTVTVIVGRWKRVGEAVFRTNTNKSKHTNGYGELTKLKTLKASNIICEPLNIGNHIIIINLLKLARLCTLTN